MDFAALTDWFVKEKREFPWREEATPYGVWVSEVMLQQTQASVVVDYFERWMQLFPTVEALALAPEESVIKAWEGLGYYSRARNLQKGAQMLLLEYGGELPQTRQELLRIPGIGAYTAGAILSFAFKQRAAAVDGNVLRVVARFDALEEEINSPAVQKKIADKVEALLPEERPWVAMEALIELGATHCGKRPLCGRCPLRQGCRARLEERTEALPKRAKRAAVTLLHRKVAIILHRKRLLVRKVPAGKVMAGLYEFPYWEKAICLEELGLKGRKVAELAPQQHTFTRYRASLFPSLWEVEAPADVQGHEWAPIQEVADYPFSSGHRRILQEILIEGWHANTTH